MELAIPLIALGGIYVVSNQKSNNTSKEIYKENFANLHQNKPTLPDKMPRNYPVLNKSDVKNSVISYPSSNTATETYMNQTMYNDKVRANINVSDNMDKIYSLTGNQVNSSDFNHNNMVPFIGSKVRGKIYNIDANESRLDNMAGIGSQHMRKEERAPLFRPQENVQWTYGAPNMTDFYMSRQVDPTRQNNVLPFQQIRVGAPGMDKGYVADSNDGYNSALNSRDLYMPRNVDELRVATNPREEFSLLGHEGPAQSAVKNVGIIGKMEKNRPDTFFVNTPDRWLTTTGAEKGHRIVSEEVLKKTNRNETTSSYVGTASAPHKNANYVVGEFEESHRIQLPAHDVGASVATGRGPIDDGDNNLNSFTNYANNRSTTGQAETFGSGFSRAIGAVIAPLMDVLKPTRKEEYVGNMRVFGNALGEMGGSYVYNPNDVPAPTNKEMSLHATRGNIGNQSSKVGGYHVTEVQPVSMNRDTTNISFTPAAGGAGARYGNTQYDPYYRQTLNENKVAVGWTNQGNMSLFNGDINLTAFKPDVQENTNYGLMTSLVPRGPSAQTHGVMQMPENPSESYNNARLSGDLLRAFRENPYTQSLSSVA